MAETQSYFQRALPRIIWKAPKKVTTENDNVDLHFSLEDRGI